MSARITITWTPPAGYESGDYALLYGNGGEGEIDFNSPAIGDKHELTSGWGTPPAAVTINYDVQFCGDYKFALQIFDKLGNPAAAAPVELEATVHIAPPAPAGLKGKSYDKYTYILILQAA